MKARPILFSGEMILALLEGRKTQTRRIVKPQPNYRARPSHAYQNVWNFIVQEIGNPLSNAPQKCPYGQPGDLLWVREGFRSKRVDKLPGDVIYRADHPDASHVPGMYGRPWKPSIHMPRWASRLTLRITDVRVERVQEISREDAVSEGCESPLKGTELEGVAGDYVADEKTSFAILWQSINGPESWDANPWVWVVEFEVIQANVDQVLERDAA